MAEVRRRMAVTLATLRETLGVAYKVRDTARADGREELARYEDAAIAKLGGHIVRLERRAAELAAHQARRDGSAG